MKFLAKLNERSFSGIIPKGVLIKGDLLLDATVKTLHIEGMVEGNIIAAGDTTGVYLDDKSKVVGKVEVPALIVNGGAVYGDIITQQIILKGGAVIKGDLTYSELSIEAGSLVNGRLINDTPPTQPGESQA